MGTVDIQVISLCFFAILLIIPIVISYVLKLGFIKSMSISLVRMVIQLTLIGVFLKYVFQWNNPFINVAWFCIMLIVGAYSTGKSCNVKILKFILPIFTSFLISVGAIILIAAIVIFPHKSLFDVKTVIVVGGMLLGNTLRSNIIGINTFYGNLRKEKQNYMYVLSLGATQNEALLPYLRESMRSALKPTIANLATMGIVFLPGMMTGTILGGASPIVAIKYQLMIMIAIFVSTNIGILLTIINTALTSFDQYGMLKEEIFVNGKKGQQQ